MEKERTAPRKRGDLSEKEADPICFHPYRSICSYAVHVNEAFLWALTILIWSCMARPINIDNHSMNNISLGVDSYYRNSMIQRRTKMVNAVTLRPLILNHWT